MQSGSGTGMIRMIWAVHPGSSQDHPATGMTTGMILGQKMLEQIGFIFFSAPDPADETGMTPG